MELVSVSKVYRDLCTDPCKCPYILTMDLSISPTLNLSIPPILSKILEIRQAYIYASLYTLPCLRDPYISSSFRLLQWLDSGLTCFEKTSYSNYGVSLLLRSLHPLC